MRDLPDHLVFSRDDARALGWSDSALTRAVVAGRLCSPRRGMFTRPGDADARGAVLAAARQLQGAVVSHRSALHLLGLPVVGRSAPLPELTVVPTGRGSAHGVHLHRAALPSSDVVLLDGVLITSAARTVIDVARQQPLLTAVAAIDAALQRRAVTHNDLDAVLLRCWNWPGIRRAQRAVRLADGRSESPLESVSRLVLARLRLPAPLLQPLVLDPRGRPLARLDFYWDEAGVAGEADGRSKYDGRGVLIAEKERQEACEDLGLPFTRWGWLDTRRPAQLRDRIERALARGRARERSGLPRLWSIRPAEPVGRGEKPGAAATAGPPRASP